ncbi:MAG: DUF434 domain-containing protein [Planctomycetales bacterium]|nr:DUF434 domain-containing protein [Planctomycetales bacterium]
MPDTRSHRGPHPGDRGAFGPEALPALRAAVADLSWLLSRGYAAPSSVKLVGDRHGLTARQRIAVQRSACADADSAGRRARELAAPALAGATLLLDGWNVLTTVEAALGGGLVLVGRDGAWRDLASVHGTFRRVEETGPALALLGETLEAHGVARAVWYLDRPVGNSGRIRAALLRLAAERGWPWEAELVPDPDRVLAAASGTVATSDSAILDRCVRWTNLAREAVARGAPGAWVVDLSDRP